MQNKIIAIAALLVAAATVTAVAAGGAATTRQQVAFVYANGNPGKMRLTPLTAGPVLRDSGSTSWCCWTEKFVRQDGDSVEIDNPLATFTGKRGSLTWRERITWINSGDGYSVTTGTWRIERGTGAYRHLAGRGHLAFISGAGDRVVTFRAVGLVDQGG